MNRRSLLAGITSAVAAGSVEAVSEIAAEQSHQKTTVIVVRFSHRLTTAALKRSTDALKAWAVDNKITSPILIVVGNVAVSTVEVDRVLPSGVR